MPFSPLRWFTLRLPANKATFGERRFLAITYASRRRPENKQLPTMVRPMLVGSPEAVLMARTLAVKATYGARLELAIMFA